jgi:hypothetical protein
VSARHDGAADGRALLPGLDRHLTHQLLHEEVELGVVGRHVVGQDGAVERIGLGIEGDAVLEQVRPRAQQGGGVGTAGKRHHVLPVEAIEQVPGAADDQLQGTLG